MERRHQVFISSTFLDLIDERREVIEALLEMDAIPAGMELFAAGNTDQWTLIQQVIDQSDYYLVIVGGRYGSTTAEGISYTEKEYDYAVSQKIPLMGFVHSNPAVIPAGKSEMDPAARAKLDEFLVKVKRRIVRQYSTPAELGGVVSRGLIKLQRDFPQPGWVRGNFAMTPETNAQLADLRAEVAELKQAAAEQRPNVESMPRIEGLASGPDHFSFKMEVAGTSRRDEAKPSFSRPNYVWTIPYDTTWDEVLQAVGPSLMDEASEREITDSLKEFGGDLMRAQKRKLPTEILTRSGSEIAGSTVQDVLVQLFALNLISHGGKRRTSSDRNRYWTLTPSGQDQVMKLRAIRRPDVEQLIVARRMELRSLTVAELRLLATSEYKLEGKGLKNDLVEAIIAAQYPADERSYGTDSAA
jgi:hypothetical protein